MWSRTISRLVAAVMVAAPMLMLPALAQLKPDVVPVPNSDEAMAKAIAKARATLPDFFAILAKPQQGDNGFAVKIHYDFGNNRGEHIWANTIAVNGKDISANISNQPRDIPNLKFGQRVTVPVTQLSDWMFIRDGKIHGGQTIRAVLPMLPPDRAAEMRARLAPE